MLIFAWLPEGVVPACAARGGVGARCDRIALVRVAGTAGAGVPEGAGRMPRAAARGAGLRVGGQREAVGEDHRAGPGWPAARWLTRALGARGARTARDACPAR